MGYMQGLILDSSIPVGSVVQKALDNGLIILSASGNVIRLLPPLIAEEKEIDEMIRILDKIL